MVYAYDVETYPNITTFDFVNVDDLDDTATFVLTDDDNSDAVALKDWIRGFGGHLTLVGHNSIMFDDIILEAVMLMPKQIKPIHLSILAKKLIRRDYDNIKNYKAIRYPKKRWYYQIDTMMLTRVNQNRLSLKHAAVVLRHDWIQDLPLDPNEPVAENNFERLLRYNRNDVLITVKLYHHLQPLLATRRGIGQVFGVDVLTANDTEIAKRVLDELYAERTLTPYSEFGHLRTPREVIHVKECMPNLQFKTEQLQKLARRLANYKLTKRTKYKYRLNLEFDGIKYKIGVGGLHSDDKPIIYETDDQYIIRDADVTSFYPYILLINKYKPAHLPDAFLDIYRQIVEERIVAKAASKKGDKDAEIRQLALKIAINSCFGLMGNEYYWLYDPQALVSVTISGQLYLLYLIEMLALEGIQTLSANTDGIVCRVPRDKEHIYKEVCSNWCDETKFELEFNDYRKLILRDVNNYVAIHTSGKIKTKGIFQEPWYDSDSDAFWDMAAYQVPIADRNPKLTTVAPLMKGYRFPVVAYALYQYFVNGIAPETTIRGHKNILDFCLSQRVDVSKFDVVASRVEDGNIVHEELQKTNRLLVVSHDGSVVFKRHQTDDRNLSFIAGEQLQVLNRIDTTAVEAYNVKYQYYIKQAQDIIEKIEPKRNIFKLLGG